MVPSVSETDKAYAAGLVDGEGSVGVCWRLQSKRSKNMTFGVNVRVAMIDPDSIMWLRDHFGGCVDNTNRTRGGNVIFRWTLHCRKAADFLESILPYLKLKKSRSEAAIKLARMSRKRGATKGDNGMAAMTKEETEMQRPLAEFIRSENQRSNPKIANYAKWGIQ